ncbi:aspartate dehydrogenase [Natranaerofaba carboxydovora]|uniref:aspartate dehydrogenase n=1 Tax=Natranaerofaba carboxydovora TaxID=2742683 RepID=UPI001F132B63|nr:aspartate dehydrogenase [Natranaerofaba carboxydovora]UMZ72485.1 L-aspartate dehydrogenase [Natranaerofaba carboxydovora]
MIEVGLIGAGSIGQTLSDAIINGGISGLNLKIIGDHNLEGAKKLADKHSCSATSEIYNFTKIPLDLVVEAASQNAVYKYSEIILNNNIDLLIMSVGALTDDKLYSNLKDISNKNNSKIYIPSGAIGGIDLIKTAKLTGLNSVKLTTRKPPKSLDVESSAKEAKEKVVFNGSAREAVKAYPANVNVAAILSLAGLGPDKTKVKVICDPNVKNNIHEVDISGQFGSCTLKISNLPSPQNNKTSHLACLSVISALDNLSSNIIIGN